MDQTVLSILYFFFNFQEKKCRFVTFCCEEAIICIKCRTQIIHNNKKKVTKNMINKKKMGDTSNVFVNQKKGIKRSNSSRLINLCYRKTKN